LASAYLVVNIEVTDPVRYQDYIRQVKPIVEAYGGRYLVRGGHREVLEGNWKLERVVVIEFSDMARARLWWNSPEYASVKKIRQESAKTDMVIIEGN
jgi:uncharacterized protein (DUF1330 family)